MCARLNTRVRIGNDTGRVGVGQVAYPWEIHLTSGKLPQVHREELEVSEACKRTPGVREVFSVINLNARAVDSVIISPSLYELR